MGWPYFRCESKFMLLIKSHKLSLNIVLNRLNANSWSDCRQVLERNVTKTNICILCLYSFSIQDSIIFSVYIYWCFLYYPLKNTHAPVKCDVKIYVYHIGNEKVYLGANIRECRLLPYICTESNYIAPVFNVDIITFQHIGWYSTKCMLVFGVSCLHS